LIVELQKIKFKKISEDEQKVYLRRLNRFKYPLDKRQRVYLQILTAHTIEPKISKKTFDMLSPAEADELTSYIWNESFPGKIHFNQAFFENEVRCFNSRKMLEDLFGVALEDEPDKAYLKKIITDAGYEYPSDAKTYDEIYIALQRQYALNLPEFEFAKVNKVLLVEGATEEILLPKFAKLLGFDFEKEGIFLIASGGKNQVLKDYLAYKENLNLPMKVLLDFDAKEQYDIIKSILRPQDDIFLIEEGEFEDLLDEKLILKALNREFRNTAQVEYSDLSGELQGDLPMCDRLYELYKIKGLGEFKKVEFAKIIFEALSSKNEIGEKFQKLMEFQIS
jgi:hypothetical protein